MGRAWPSEGSPGSDASALGPRASFLGLASGSSCTSQDARSRRLPAWRVWPSRIDQTGANGSPANNRVLDRPATTGGGVTKSIKVSLIVWALPVVLALCLVATLASVAFAQNEPRVGTWELNLSKSTFSPGPPPKSQVLTFHAAGPHWTALLQGIDASGRPINPDMSNVAINFDGKDHPTPNVDYETSAWKRLDAHTYEVIRKKAGRVVLTSIKAVSTDGKTMPITTKGVNADGQPINNVGVYDKR